MASRVLVVGSGAIGLRSALDLVRRNVQVILRSPKPPTDSSTCSMGAGGLWMPFHCDDKRTSRWALETLDELMTEVDKDDPLVEIVHTVQLKRKHEGPSVGDYVSSISSEAARQREGGDLPLPEWTKDPRLDFQHMTAEMLSWQNIVFKLRLPSESQLKRLGYLHAWHFKPPIVDSPRMLERMLDELRNDDKAVNVDVETGQYYSSMDEMVDDAVQMECDGLLNCTGLGSASICKDEALVGARGVLLQYDRATAKRTMQVHAVTDDELVNDAVILIEDAPLGSETMPCYLIPRGNLLVVGGTYLEGDPATEIRPKERERLLLNAKALGIDSDSTPHIGEWVGFRPYRPTTRCELDTSFDKLRVVHNYGHGGSGWTVYIGAAAEGVRLMTGG